MGTFFVNEDGTWYSAYGDPGYSNQKFVKVGRKNQAAHKRQKEFNATMSALGVSVEYGFGKILQQFAFQDFVKTQRMYLSPLKPISRFGIGELSELFTRNLNPPPSFLVKSILSNVHLQSAPTPVVRKKALGYSKVSFEDEIILKRQDHEMMMDRDKLQLERMRMELAERRENRPVMLYWHRIASRKKFLQHFH